MVRSTAALVPLLFVLAMPASPTPVEARAGGGFSAGSRGARTFSMPSSTFTAPRAAQPFQRTETQQPGLGTSGVQPRRFGFGSGLMAGLLGAGVFGLLAGGGFGGGGLLLQILLIGGLVWLALRFFRSRTPGAAFAGGIGGYARQTHSGPGGSGAGAPPRSARTLDLAPQDFAAFEGALVDIQAAFGREDFYGLSRLTTPEMLRVFGADIERNRAQNLRNEVRDARLLQGDLAEAWREGTADYATLAMRFAVLDTMVERASGRIVSGDAARPSEATELWTFRRDGGGPWLLSGIQQTT